MFARSHRTCTGRPTFGGFPFGGFHSGRTSAHRAVPATEREFRGRTRRAIRIALALLPLTLALAGCASPPGGLITPEPPVLYPLPPDLPRVQFLTSITRSDEIVPPDSAFQRFVVGNGGPVVAVQGPWGVTARDDKIYVCDLRQRTVLVIDLANRAFRAIDTSGRGVLRKPVQCDFDAAGNLLVADRERRQVVIFGPDEKYRGEVGPLDDAFLPLDVEERDGELFVCDLGNRCVQVIDAETGALLRRIGGPDHFSRPTNLALDDAGDVHVVDAIRNQITVFRPDGTEVRKLGGPGDVIGTFGRVRGIDIDADGNIFVADAGSEVVQIFRPDGEVAMFFGGPGTDPGCLYLPAGVCVTTTGLEPLRSFFSDEIDIDRLVIVISQFGARIVNIYGFGTPKNGS